MRSLRQEGEAGGLQMGRGWERRKVSLVLSALSLEGKLADGFYGSRSLRPEHTFALSSDLEALRREVQT